MTALCEFHLSAEPLFSMSHTWLSLHRERGAAIEAGRPAVSPWLPHSRRASGGTANAYWIISGNIHLLERGNIAHEAQMWFEFFSYLRWEKDLQYICMKEIYKSSKNRRHNEHNWSVISEFSKIIIFFSPFATNNISGSSRWIGRLQANSSQLVIITSGGGYRINTTSCHITHHY